MSAPFPILMVDDEAAWLRSMRLMLLRNGIDNVIECSDSRKALDILQAHDVGLVLLDLTMPHLSGEELLALIRQQPYAPRVIIITGLNDVEGAVRCIKAGAFDYFVKTSGEERLITSIRHALSLADLEMESNRAKRLLLNDTLEHPEAFEQIVTVSPAMHRIFKYIEAISHSRQPVLITGESGTGKELFAKALHRAWPDKGELVTVNLASLDEHMLTDTLFGHAKGAFTNAQSDREGLAEQAGGGTLFLDEFAEISLASQVKLLRFLQEGEYYPLGSDRKKLLKARVVLATNQDLAQLMEQNLFRKDLYYRLMVHHIHVPPLRERPEDLAVLLRHFAKITAEELGVKTPEIPAGLARLLASYAFPGNVRELKAMVLHSLSMHGELAPQNFAGHIGVEGDLERDLPGETDLLEIFLNMSQLPSFSEVKNVMTAAAMQRSGGNQTLAAKLLGISQAAISKRLHSDQN